MKENLALYRKYRPGAFDEVRGQVEVVEALKAAVAAGKVAHAYLFAGGRGTGKTTLARILADALGTSDKDLWEMDAASNRGIDEVRALRDAVSTMPFDSHYKVYIIDEAHALTRDAWGALLKTLEEPPAHVIFVLATTELDRIPETIISRCQVFNFKKPSQAERQKLALDVAKKEGAQLSPSGAELVALMGEGSFRDTLGVLQKVLTISAGKKISDEDVAKIVGAPPAQLTNQFLQALGQKNIAGALEAFHTAITGGSEPSVFILLAITRMRAILLLRFAPGMKKELQEQFSEEDMQILETLAGKEGAALNAQLLAELITALLETRRAPIPQLPLELALYRVFETKV